MASWAAEDRGRRLAIWASAARSSLSARNSPCAGALPEASVYCSLRLPPGQCRPSSATNCSPWVENSKPPCRRRPPRRPSMEGNCSACNPAPRVACTSASARSAVPPTIWPRCTSAQARRAPRPRATSMPTSAWWRRRETSTREKWANSCPFQCCQLLSRTRSRGARNMPTSVKRSPQASGGVASTRRLWRQLPLRSTTSTFCSDSSGAPRISSFQRTVPSRITTSPCENSQSVAALLSPVPCEMGRPATKIRPSAARRMSRSGEAIYSCSKPQCSSERGDSETTTRGRRSAARFSPSSSATSSSSMEGINPSERAEISPMRTATPNARVACASI